MKTDILEFLKYKDPFIIGVLSVDDYDSERYIVEYLYKMNDESDEEKSKCLIIKEDLQAYTKGIKAKIEWL